MQIKLLLGMGCHEDYKVFQKFAMLLCPAVQVGKMPAFTIVGQKHSRTKVVLLIKDAPEQLTDARKRLKVLHFVLVFILAPVGYRTSILHIWVDCGKNAAPKLSGQL